MLICIVTCDNLSCSRAKIGMLTDAIMDVSVKMLWIRLAMNGVPSLSIVPLTETPVEFAVIMLTAVCPIVVSAELLVLEVVSRVS